MPNKKGDLDALKLQLDQARRFVEQSERQLADAKTRYDSAWKAYAAVKEVTVVEAKVRTISHHLEGSMTVERKARFSDLSGLEIAPGTGAKLVLTQGDKRWEADIADSEVSDFLDTLNNPEEKKKRGRPTTDSGETAKPEAAAAKSS